MFCTSCGNSLSIDSKFCGKCGAKVDGETSQPMVSIDSNPVKKRNMTAPVIIISIIFFICLVIGISINEVKNEAVKEAIKSAAYDLSIFESDYEDYRITSCDYVHALDGYHVYIVASNGFRNKCFSYCVEDGKASETYADNYVLRKRKDYDTDKANKYFKKCLKNQFYSDFSLF